MKAPATDSEHPDFNVLASDHGAALATIPRYEGFTTYRRWVDAGDSRNFVQEWGPKTGPALRAGMSSPWTCRRSDTAPTPRLRRRWTTRARPRRNACSHPSG
jgi:hypothetical protein